MRLGSASSGRPRSGASLVGIVTVAVLGAAATPVPAQQVPTPGVVQEPLKQRRPEAPATPDDLTTAPAATPATTGVAPGGKAIPVREFRFEGNSAISTAELEAEVAGELGRSLTLFEIYEIADALTAFYRERGYTVASVTVPAQKVSSGTVRLEVIEGRVGEVRLEGNQRQREDFLRSQLGQVRPGEVLTDAALQRDLLPINDIPGLTARAVVQPGSNYGESNLILRAEEDTFEGAARANNYGRRSIGEYRLEADLAANGLLGYGDRLAFNGVHADGGDLDYIGVRYEIGVWPVPGLRAAAYYNTFDYTVDSDELDPGLQALAIDGDGDNFGFTLTYPWIRTPEQTLITGIGYDRNITRQLTGGLGIKDKRDISLMVLTALYSRTHSDRAFTTVSGIISTNFADNVRDINGSPGNNQQPFKLQLDGSHYRLVTERWAVFLRGTVVYSPDQLVDVEKFRLGGQENVRAYPSAQLAGDAGFAFTAELQRGFAFGSLWPMQFAAFVDTGRVWREDSRLIGQNSSESITGAGFGLDAFFTGNSRLSLQVAKPLGQEPSVGGEDGVRAWAGLTVNF